MMRSGPGRHLLGTLAVLLVCLRPALCACVVTERTRLEPTISGGLIVMTVEINGIPASFILDTGAQRSVVSDAAVKRLALARDQWVGTTMGGIGGIDRRPNANPRSLTLGGVPLVRRTLSHDTSLTVAVLPRAAAAGSRIDGLLGRDYLSEFDLDVDVDMAGRQVILYQPTGCSGRFLPWSGAYTSVPVTMPAESAIVVPVTVDGVPLRALLDTGASGSLIAAPGMFRMGIELASLAADPGDLVSGLGSRVVTMRRHQFRSLRIGEQAIEQPLLWVAPIRLQPIVDMLLGADWLATRRIWISYSTKQLFVQTR